MGAEYMGTFNRRFSRRPVAPTTEDCETWLVRSRPRVSPPEARRPGSSWPPRPPGSLPPPPEEGRSHGGTGPAQSLCVRSGVTRSRPSCSSASCPSRGLSGRSLRTFRLTWGSSPLPLVLSSWPGGSVANVHKKEQSVTYSLGTPCGPSVTELPCSLKFSNTCALTFLSIHNNLSTHMTKSET